MKVLNSTKCVKCGVQINGTHMKGRLTKPIKGFYGGRVDQLLECTCDCEEKYIACLKARGNTYEVIDLGEVEKEVEEVEEEVEEEKEEETGIESLSRQEVIKLAQDVGVSGKITTFKTKDLIKKIQNKQA